MARALAAVDVQDLAGDERRGLQVEHRIHDVGYLSVDFGFTDRPTLTVYLSVIARRTGESWLINHYQVSRLGDSDGNHSVHS